MHTIEMNFCRRCGAQLTFKGADRYECAQGHEIFMNAAPAMAVLLASDEGEVIVLERAIDPGKGRLDAPGGFCDGAETLEAATARELKEELGLEPADYDAPEFMFTAIDWYDYHGEHLPVLSHIYKARLHPGALFMAADDAASAVLVPIQDVDLDKVYFDSVREGFARLQSE